MLRRMCEEKPQDWDRYLPVLLFAYREVPKKASLFAVRLRSFSPRSDEYPERVVDKTDCRPRG